MGKATTTIFIDKYHPKADKTCSISIRVTFERKLQYYLTGYSLTIEDFNRVILGIMPKEKISRMQRETDKALRQKITEKESNARAIIETLPVFTWDAFDKHYNKNMGAKTYTKLAFDEYAKKLRDEGRINTAINYECASKSLDTFAPNAKFTDVTPDWLRNYEKWTKNKSSTIGIYLRPLRALFNAAIYEGILPAECYPFRRNPSEKDKYQIPTGRGIKKALTDIELAAIYNYKFEPEMPYEKSRDYWLFLCFANGMNMKDMCLLKYENIDGGFLTFIRAKTARTRRDVQPIEVVLTDELKDIISKWGNKDRDGNTDRSGYIFPILSKGISAEREHQLIQQVTHVVNEHMKKIKEKLKIEKSVGTYVARHTYATIQQIAGVQDSIIADDLGHSNVSTTKAYLAGIGRENKIKNAKNMTAFKNPLKVA